MSMTSEIHRFSSQIKYPFTERIRDIFVKETNAKRFQIAHDGKVFGIRGCSKTFREHLTKKGFSFIPVIHHIYVGRKKVNGIHIEVGRVRKGNKIKELLIRIPAMGEDEATDKKRSLLAFVKEKTGIEGEVIATSHRVVC